MKKVKNQKCARLDMNKLFETDDLNELAAWLSREDKMEIRKEIFGEFLIYADYKNALDWNRAVRLCECLAIIGWGDHEPVQAVRSLFFNGNPQTKFYNKFGQRRFLGHLVKAEKRTDNGKWPDLLECQPRFSRQDGCFSGLSCLRAYSGFETLQPKELDTTEPGFYPENAGQLL